MVSVEEFDEVRNRARIYFVDGVVRGIANSVLPSSYLIDLAVETIWKDMNKIGMLKMTAKMFKKLARQGTDEEQKERTESLDMMKKNFPWVTEQLIVTYDEEAQWSEKYTNSEILRRSDIEPQYVKHIDRFRRTAVKQINTRLKREIEIAGENGFGYVFNELLPMLENENAAEAYKWCWAFLMDENKSKHIIATMLGLYASIRDASTALSSFSVGDDVSKVIGGLNIGVGKEKLANGRKTGEDKVGFQSGSDHFDFDMGCRLDPEYLFGSSIIFTGKNVERFQAIGIDMAKYFIQPSQAFKHLIREIAFEYKAKAEALKTAESGAAERKVLGKISDELKVQISGRDREIKILLERIDGLEKSFDKTDARNLADLNKRLGHALGKAKELEKMSEEMEEFAESESKRADELEEKLKRYESKTAQRDPYFVLVDELNGTEWAEDAHVAVTILYHGLARKDYIGNAKIPREFFIRRVRPNVPTEKRADIEDVYDRLRKAGACMESSAGGLSLNPTVEEIEDADIKKLVEKIFKMKTEGRF